MCCNHLCVLSRSFKSFWLAWSLQTYPFLLRPHRWGKHKRPLTGVCKSIEIISRYISERLPKSKEALSVSKVIVERLHVEAALGTAVHGAACGEQPVVLLGDVLWGRRQRHNCLLLLIQRAVWNGSLRPRDVVADVSWGLWVVSTCCVVWDSKQPVCVRVFPWLAMWECLLIYWGWKHLDKSFFLSQKSWFCLNCGFWHAVCKMCCGKL